MISNSTIARAINKTYSNAYQKLNWMSKGAYSLLPDNSDKMIEAVIKEFDRQVKNERAALVQHLTNYRKQVKTK